MTRKDYILFADVLKKELDKYPKSLPDDVFLDEIYPDSNLLLIIKRQAIMELTLSIANALGKNNERFDKTKFLQRILPEK